MTTKAAARAAAFVALAGLAALPAAASPPALGDPAFSTSASTLPRPSRPWGEIDLRGRDLTHLDLRGAGGALRMATFDDLTRWPADDRLPEKFSPGLLHDDGRRPGLKIWQLHLNRVRGTGVRIGVIGPPLRTDHELYASRIASYTEAPNVPAGAPPSLLGGAVVSILVGEKHGVAPDAAVEYVAALPFDPASRFRTLDHGIRADALRDLLAASAARPPADRVRVVVLTSGWSPGEPGADRLEGALRAAEAAGVAVYSPALLRSHGVRLLGLDRVAGGPLDSPSNYRPGLFWRAAFELDPRDQPEVILVPMDSRTTASPIAADARVFHRSGGPAFAVAWLAGLHALAAQVDPELRSPDFLQVVHSTGRRLRHLTGGRPWVYGTLPNPVQVLDRVVRGRKARANTR